MPARTTVSSSEFIRNIGYWQNEALHQPVGITHHGRERLVLTTPEEVDAQAPRADYASLARGLADAEAVFENLEDGFCAFDAELRLTRCNQAAAALLRRSQEALSGGTLAQVFAQPFTVVLGERLRQVLRTRKAQAFEATMDEQRLSVRAFALSEGVGVLLANMTERYDQRIRLGVGDALCAAANRHPHAGGIKLDASGRIIGLHDSLCALAGLNREQVVGLRLVDLLRADQRRMVAAALDDITEGGAPREINVALLGGDGREIEGVLTLAAIQADFATHGVMALWVRHQEATGADQGPLKQFGQGSA